MLTTNFPGGGGKIESLLSENLLTGTKDFSGEWNDLWRWTKETETYKGLTVMSKSAAWTGIGKPFYFEVGKYTFSEYVRYDSLVGITYVFTEYTGEETKATTVPTEVRISNIGNEWAKAVINFEVTSPGYLTCRLEKGISDANKMYVCGQKLERGENPNPIWTPAPEDVVVRSEDVTQLVYNVAKNGIDRGSDLNDFTQPGSYYCGTGAIANTLLNCPKTTAGFRLDVIKINSDGPFVQRITTQERTNRVFYRTFETVFGNWIRVLTETAEMNSQ